LFEQPGEFDAVARLGAGVQSGPADGFAGPFADAVAMLFDLDEGTVYFTQGLALTFDEAQGELLLIIVGADVGHVDGHIGEVAAGVVLIVVQGAHRHAVDVAEDFVAAFEQQCSVTVYFLGS